jgi:hypothetical protein
LSKTQKPLGNHALKNAKGAKNAILFLKTLVHCQADFDGFFGVQSEALFGRAKLRFELQPTKQS